MASAVLNRGRTNAISFAVTYRLQTTEMYSAMLNRGKTTEISIAVLKRGNLFN
jgi:hypothetical protein